MFDELRGLDVDVSCENVEIAVFSEAENFTRARCRLVYPLQTCQESVGNYVWMHSAQCIGFSTMSY